MLMRRMFICSLIAVMLLSIPCSVFAQNYYHEMSIVVEGDYTLTTNLAIPDVVQQIDVAGTGRVMIDTKLKKFDSSSWWDLF